MASNTYSECVFVALGIQYAMPMCHTVICGLSGSTIFFLISHKRSNFLGGVMEHKMYVLIFSTSFVWNIYHSKNNWVRYDHKCILVFMWSTGYSCHIIMKLEFLDRFFEKYTEMKFRENPSSGSWLVPCGGTDGWMDGWTDRHDEVNNHFLKLCKCT